MTNSTRVMQLFTVLIALLMQLVTSIPGRAGKCTIVHRNTDGFNQTYIFDSQETKNFNQSRKWCDRLGGNLPIVHSQEELHFLYTMFAQDSQTRSYYTPEVWMGRQPINMTNSCSEQWLDGSQVDYDFDYQSTCQVCRIRSCCAMVMYFSPYPKQMGFEGCGDTNYRVCVIPGDFLSNYPKSRQLIFKTECNSIQVRDELMKTITWHNLTEWTPPVTSSPSSLRFYTMAPSKWNQRGPNASTGQIPSRIDVFVQTATSSTIFNILGSLAFIVVMLASILHISKQCMSRYTRGSKVFGNDVAFSNLESRSEVSFVK
jgi:hypothetical protein